MNLKDIFKLENHFINESFEGKGSFSLSKGKNKIIISAPHSTTHYREGSDKIGEYRTGCVVDYLCQTTESHGIYKTKHNNDDPNYDERTEYKTELEKHINNYGIKYLLDLHIMSPKREQLIDLGTGRGNNINDIELPTELLNIFKKNGLNGSGIDQVFSASYPHTISASIHKRCGIDCIQIETNWRVYENEELTKKFIKSLLEIINLLNRR